ncbi:DUF2235 domain-containing protein, partial [Hydrogenophaga sp.]|uniref:T6SS phospholipase effector Tle1-like catalytic domain-containing protein n=2 Tax=unclassified Hydrogenophaga TaxID=2610897 RepID=UPI001AC6CEB0
FLSLRYDGRGWLSEVIDPAGRRLRLHVLDKASAQDPQRYRGVQGIDTPVGRFVYEHGGQLPEGSSARPSEPIANLSQVIYPAQAPSEGGAASETGSDGAQEARCQKVNFRFMGLFDTVLSTNWSGHAYQLGIPTEFSYVAHAVALNEYRGNTGHAYGALGAFPLESILQGMASPVPVEGHTRIERGFLGAHADIGGGFGENDSQLARVALVWMVEQAEAAGVTMHAPPSTVIPDPVLHDKSNSIQTGAPAPGSEDRQVRYRDGARTVQREMPFTEGMSWADTQAFIHYLPADDPQRWRFVTGTVDMQGYLDWLNANGYGIDMKVQ